MIIRWIKGTLIGTICLGVGIAIGTAGSTPHPYCPTEDSCKIDYRDGKWTISPDNP